MDAKLLAIFLGIINYSNCAGLLRTPKVYNAVITTDENLTPSRAFPVIQPTIHETAITSTFPFAPFGPYRFYNAPLIHFAQPVPELRAEHAPIPLPEINNKPLPKAEPIPPEPIPPEMELAENLPPPPKQNPVIMPAEEKLPIPLNEFGLPPSLIPLHTYPRPARPINLQPYPYNHYPLIYDTSNQFQDHYLPPYGYYPPYGFGPNPPKQNGKKPALSPKSDLKPLLPTEGSKDKLNPDSSNFDSIKNGTENKNSEVPDVPPPPLPTGTKTSQ